LIEIADKTWNHLNKQTNQVVNENSGSGGGFDLNGKLD
jgi:hypothetical protein